jgi:hypothetical protein
MPLHDPSPHHRLSLERFAEARLCIDPVFLNTLYYESEALSAMVQSVSDGVKQS